MAEYNPSKIIKDGNTYNFRDTTKIPLAGSNQISGDLIPSTDGTVNLGSSSYQWNNAYIKSLTINGVACGDILTHNASEFVDVSSNQTIGGTKTFGSLVSKSGTLERGSLPTTIIREDPIFISVDKNNRRTLALYNYYFINGNGRVALYVYNQNTTDYDNISIAFDFNNVSNIKSVYPSITETYNLGTTTNKWKSFNGINPGALSLPSGTVSMNLIGDISVVGTEKKLSKDITVTGYIYVDVSFTSSNRLNLYNDTKKYGIWIPCDSGRIRQIMPISANDRLEFNVLDDGSTVNAIQLFACQGNV